MYVETLMVLIAGFYCIEPKTWNPLKNLNWKTGLQHEIQSTSQSMKELF